jgi:ferredoxin
VAGRLRVDWIACEGRGLCIAMFPEIIDRDDWGYPVIADEPVPEGWEDHAKRTVAACPTLALRWEPA